MIKCWQTFSHLLFLVRFSCVRPPSPLIFHIKFRSQAFVTVAKKTLKNKKKLSTCNSTNCRRCNVFSLNYWKKNEKTKLSRDDENSVIFAHNYSYFTKMERSHFHSFAPICVCVRALASICCRSLGFGGRYCAVSIWGSHENWRNLCSSSGVASNKITMEMVLWIMRETRRFCQMGFSCQTHPSIGGQNMDVNGKKLFKFSRP